MKKVFVIALLLFTTGITHAQIKVHQHIHSWAGGVCCATGEDYKLTIKIPKGEWQSFDSLLICTGNEIRRYAKSALSPSTVGDTLTVTASYSYTYNRYDERDFIELKKPVICASYLTLVKGYVRKQITVTRVTESMTAYP